MAWIMFIWGMELRFIPRHARPPRQQLRCAGVRQFREHVLEHQRHIEKRRVGQRAVGDGLLPRLDDGGFHFLFQRAVLLFGPVAERDQVALEPLHRVAERKALATRPSAGSVKGRRWWSVRRRGR
jgi:hypothetical protein